MTVITVADMFGIEGAREELAGLFERFERDAQREPGCMRYTFAATVADPAQFVQLSEWESQDALDAHYRSRLFADFQFQLQGLLARPSELTIYSTDRAVRPLDTGPMDPRDAD
jgi:quinol monooxygenase YgiN